MGVGPFFPASRDSPYEVVLSKLKCPLFVASEMSGFKVVPSPSGSGWFWGWGCRGRGQSLFPCLDQGHKKITPIELELTANWKCGYPALSSFRDGTGKGPERSSA